MRGMVVGIVVCGLVSLGWAGSTHHNVTLVCDGHEIVVECPQLTAADIEEIVQETCVRQACPPAPVYQPCWQKRRGLVCKGDKRWMPVGR